MPPRYHDLLDESFYPVILFDLNDLIKRITDLGLGSVGTWFRKLKAV